MGAAITGGGVVRLTIGTETDTYEQAIAAVQAAYELRPAVRDAWPDAPATDPRPGPQDLADDDLADGWTDQLLFQMIASLVPGARAVLRRITELGGTASYDDVQQHFAEHPTNPIPPSKIGGTLTSQGGAAPRRPGRRQASPPAGRTSPALPHRRRVRGRPPAGLRPCRRAPLLRDGQPVT